MQEQNFKNHSRILPYWHYGVYSLILAFIVGAARNLYLACEAKERLYVPVLLLLAGFILLLVATFSRWFALRAQDRAIRAEENLRYFAITGNLLDSKLRLSQIIALRFAPNNEFLDLAHRAVEENLSSKDIKAAIQNWRGDYHRV
ncbi:MAG: DUF6526 family protein [Ferruginibacter sp.]